MTNEYMRIHISKEQMEAVEKDPKGEFLKALGFEMDEYYKSCERFIGDIRFPWRLWGCVTPPVLPEEDDRCA